MYALTCVVDADLFLSEITEIHWNQTWPLSIDVLVVADQLLFRSREKAKILGRALRPSTRMK